MDRFWSKVDRRGPDECWPWTGGTLKDGYGAFYGGPNKTLQSHRVAFEERNGPIPKGLEVCHECDNPPCCNPQHLFAASHLKNMQDMDKKGRRQGGKREAHGSSKLTEAKVSQIRRDYVKGSRTHGTTALGKKYGVSHAVIWSVIKRKTWQ